MGTSRQPADFTQRATRFRLSLPLQYRCAAEEAWRVGEIRDISRSGVFFHSNHPVAPETLVELTFSLPTPIVHGVAANVVCLGQVVRTGPVVPGDGAGLAVAIRDYRFERGK